MTAATCLTHHEVLTSPLGPVFVGASVEGLHVIEFIIDGRDAAELGRRLDAAAREAPAAPAGREAPTVPRASTDGAEAVAAAIAQLREFFAGGRRRFALPLAPHGTPFQRAVWRELRDIPHGATTSYGAVARAVGRPEATRAVGAAIGRNPLAIVVPCHRVVGAAGALTGYASGLDRKRWLLAHEGVAVQGELVAAPAFATAV